MIAFRDDDGSVFFMEPEDIRMIYPRFDACKNLDGSRLICAIGGVEVQEVEVRDTPETVLKYKQEGEGCLSISFILSELDEDEDEGEDDE